LFELERTQETESESEGADIPHCKEGVTTPLDISPKLFTIEKSVVLFAKPFELVNIASFFWYTSVAPTDVFVIVPAPPPELRRS